MAGRRCQIGPRGARYRSDAADHAGPVLLNVEWPLLGAPERRSGAGAPGSATRCGRLHELRDARESVERSCADGITAERAVAWLRALSETWRAAEVPAERADLLHAVYDRITVAGRRIVSVRLTPSAYAHGFALALPEKGCTGAPDRCWVRVNSLRDARRGPRRVDRRGRAFGMRDGRLRGAFSPQATRRQVDVLAAYVAARGSVSGAAKLVGIRPSTVKRHLADLRARSGLTTEQLIYRGRAEGWLVVPSLESD